ncbi:MAG: hypothetical protein U9N18_05460 [Campylobacterota bacterium]|nr:hypothetical protein [Campylobacterota bacterium]
MPVTIVQDILGHSALTNNSYLSYDERIESKGDTGRGGVDVRIRHNFQKI